ncbi:peptidoglycan-binding domain-containing protein [Streptomyces sp. NRRL B-3229]|uniref:peptidoglycan-binding domain-containing protein n=1 Tax=Streptomyces sp. NRRL B-3229 TaxID=1463836 RepID=UPI0004BFD417|nr:peptidoglycan-binding domain-containing protein [Streptomyces sp. NRRL B-3229]
MPTPSDRGVPPDDRAIEPIRVLRPRRTDALAELLKDLPPGPSVGSGRPAAGYEPIVLPGRPSGTEDATEELPPVRDDPRVRDIPRGRVPGLRRTAVAAAVTAAAVIGFGGALLLTDRTESTAVAAPRPSATAPAAPVPTPTPSGAGDPDGAGTLREGDRGPEVTDLQERLRHIPNVYDNGSTDGTYDATLAAAVARFQLWYGIRGDEDGVYGDDTRHDLESRTGGG